ncbi:uroporphyrinogen-III C-methyltransferase [Endozoicomonas sp. SM1973]|uniref:Uroporphyrinogen-III C-methyltransferase n=1 Tax=Spartinivicinus marinus TaxID=2994442 RepID=A0A853IFU7_9GAMM|nr:uroporphyrinogen-III C-methyltransferase [Spartinivicinus marinus]MCX4027432.1 uroporphyrinogen-III C-methyltransferase [Spartinivicinus marinus]NYZ66396.1 uroporphyrinogen-III C-methyltransferase [Spartinivicinus marinus]
MTNNTNGNKPTDAKSSGNAKEQLSKQKKQSKQSQTTQSQTTESKSAVTEEQSPADLSKGDSTSNKYQAAATTESEKKTESETKSAREPLTPLTSSASAQGEAGQTSTNSTAQPVGNNNLESNTQSAATVVKRGWSGPVALAISLAALVGVGGIAYLDYDVRYFFDKKQSFNPVEVSQAEAAKVESKLAESVNAARQQMSSQVDEVSAQLTQQQQQLSSTEQKLKQDVLGVAENISNLRRQFNQMQGTSRDDWQLAEVEYMLRLANQRLLTEGDIRGVEAILVSADAILRGLDNYSLYSVREALANDLAAVRAVEQTDVEGTYLKISALVSQVMELPLMPVSDYQKSQSAPAKKVEQADTGFSDKVSAKLKQTWSNFSDHLRINISRDKPVQVLLTPKEELFLRQNLRMMFEQAQLALLQQNQLIYSNSLEKAASWLKEYFIYESTKVAAINKQLKQLAAIKLNPKLPDISGSLKATKQYIDELHRLHKGKLPRKDEEVAKSSQQSISVNLSGEAH